MLKRCAAQVKIINVIRRVLEWPGTICNAALWINNTQCCSQSAAPSPNDKLLKQRFNTQAKSRHLLCCQMLRCQDQCPRCPLFQAGGQNGFGTSLTQLASATPCQQTELTYVYWWDEGGDKQRQQRGVCQHRVKCHTHTQRMNSGCMKGIGGRLTRWFGFDVSVRGCHSIQVNVTWLKQRGNHMSTKLGY